MKGVRFEDCQLRPSETVRHSVIIFAVKEKRGNVDEYEKVDVKKLLGHFGL
jgi:hypothetical protein